MNYPELIQHSIDYAEKHLDTGVRVEDMAREACCSFWHFQRVFSALTGMTASDYLRARKFSCAVRELLDTDARILDIALRYGYDAPEAFTRAFRKVYAFTPSDARRVRPALTCMSKLVISKRLLMGGDQMMQYKMIEKEAMRIAGRGIRVSCSNGENFRRIPLFWQETIQEGWLSRLEDSLQMPNPTVSLGICAEWNPQDETFLYFIGVETTKDATVPEGFEILEVPPAKYAVFTAKGPLPDSVQSLTPRIYSEWFPSSGYQRDEKPDFEWYDMARMNPSNPADDETDIYIPVK